MKRIRLLLLSAIVASMFSPNEVVWAAHDSAVIDALILKARQQLEMDQQIAYSRAGSHPKSFTKEQIDRLSRAADDRLLAALSRFPSVSEADLKGIKVKLSAARTTLDRMSPPTKYEDLLRYRVIQTVLKQISDGASEFKKQHPNIPPIMPSLQQIVVGTVPSGYVNASTQPINPDELDKSHRVYLIEFDAGLLKFAEVFSGMLARIAAPADPTGKFLVVDLNQAEVEKYLQAHPTITQDFDELMHVYLTRGGPFLATQFQT